MTTSQFYQSDKQMSVHRPITTPTISCVIVTYYPGDELIACIESIKLNIKCSFEIIISDNTSEKSRTLDHVEKIFPDVKIVKNLYNGGFSYGNNRGVENSRAPYLLLVNPDAVLLSPITDEMLTHANRSGIIAGVSRNNKGVHKITAGRFPIHPTRVFSLTGRMDPRDSLRTGKFDSRFIRVDYNEGSCYLLSRETFDSVNGFDENIFLYGEDYEISYRVYKSGKVNQIDTSLIYLHDGGYSDTREPHIVNGLIYFSRKHFGRWQELKMRSVLLLRYSVILMISLLTFGSNARSRARIPSVMKSIRNTILPNPYVSINSRRA